MTGFLQRICEHVSFLRLGANCRAAGDAWDFGFGVLHAGPVARVFGLHGTMTVLYWRSAADVLLDAGFTHVEFERLKDGTFTPHRRRLRRSHAVSGSRVAPESEPQGS